MKIVERIITAVHMVPAVLVVAFFATYHVVGFATWVYLMFYDGWVYNWHNWIIALVANIILASIWPIYWGILHWIRDWNFLQFAALIAALIVGAIMAEKLSNKKK